MNGIKKITISEFEDVFKEKISDYLKEKINEYDFSYDEFSKEDEKKIISDIEKHLNQKDIVKAGEHRKEEWEKGWGENLNELNIGEKNVIPKYFAKHDILRWKQKFIRPIGKDFELNSLYVIQDWLFDKYIRDTETIYEFGCGTGHNLLHVWKINPNAEIWGLDWAKSSQEIIKKLDKDNPEKDFHGENLDYFNPNHQFKLKNNSVVFTVASLEQIGDKFEKFTEYILEQNISLCIHIEPIIELLDEENVLDNLSIRYIKKRNYLTGYLEYLRKLETDGKLKILRSQRSYIGSMFIDGYSIIVWSPTKNGSLY